MVFTLGVLLFVIAGLIAYVLVLQEQVENLKLDLKHAHGRLGVEVMRRGNAEKDAQAMRARLLERQGPR